MKLDALQKNIGYNFNKNTLLLNALTHSSYLNEVKDGSVKSNERLEFLGDSVLGLTVSEYLYKNYPKHTEGELSKIRASVVCEASLAKIANKYQLGEYMRFSKGELRSNGKCKPSVLADAVESLIAAMFLDGGIEPAKKFVLENLENAIIESAKYGGDDEDYKSKLQEYAQSVGETVIYEIISQSGPEHNTVFEAQATINGIGSQKGTGSSKKKAEQQSAKKLLKMINK